MNKTKSVFKKPRKKTETFLPTDEVRRLLDRAMKAMGEKPKPPLSSIINAALEKGIPAMLEAKLRQLQAGLKDSVENAGHSE